jgi:hypothetical protein
LKFNIKNALKYLYIFIVSISLGCSHKATELNNLQGNWYTINTPKISNTEFDFVYQEIYFSNNRIFYYNNISGFRVPNYYKVKNDSLYMSFYKDKDFDFLSVIIYGDDKFSISKMEDTVHFYKLKNVKNTLDKFLILNDSISDFHQKETEFTQGFINRSEKTYSKK